MEGTIPPSMCMSAALHACMRAEVRAVVDQLLMYVATKVQQLLQLTSVPACGLRAPRLPSEQRPASAVTPAARPGAGGPGTGFGKPAGKTSPGLDDSSSSDDVSSSSHIAPASPVAGIKALQGGVRCSQTCYDTQDGSEACCAVRC